MRLSGRPAVVAAAAALLFLAPVGTAYALWTSSGKATVQVTIAAPAVELLAPFPTCSPGRTNNNNFTMSWTAVENATHYVVESSPSNSSGSYSTQTSGTATSYTHVTDSNSSFTRYFRVTAWNGADSSPSSRVIRLIRTGNGSSNYQCDGVTP